MRILVVAPHPDDEVINCGGIIARAAKRGATVDLALGTVGGLKRSASYAEVSRAAGILGVAAVEILSPDCDAELDAIPQKHLVSALDDVLAGRAYTEIYIPAPTAHQDHQAIHQASVAALRRASESVRLVAMYGCNPLIGKLYVNITATLAVKCKAMEAYASQLRPYPSPCSTRSIRLQAAVRGQEVRCDYAELYQILWEQR